MVSRLQKIEYDESVQLMVTHSNPNLFSADIRFSLQSSVESVKDKLGRKCGISVDSIVGDYPERDPFEEDEI